MDKKEAERIFCRRKNEEDGAVQYYIKWKNLPYDKATWEDEELVKGQYPEQYKQLNKPKMAYSRDLPKMAVMDDHGLS